VPLFDGPITVQDPSKAYPAKTNQYFTGLPLTTLQQVAKQLTRIPEDFTPHPEVRQLLERRRDMMESIQSRVDFAFAELLAFGTLSLHRPRGAEHSTRDPLTA
jgi:2-oxoglutarate dehydrogenase complex dehydrogenase (E1) component-like enzyme